MDCPFCKYPVEEGASFCGECGRRLPSVAAPTDSRSESMPQPSSPQPPMPTIVIPKVPSLDLPPLPVTPLPDVPVPEVVVRPPPTPAGDCPQQGHGDTAPFTLELDSMLPFREIEGNSLRILFTPSSDSDVFDNMSISISEMTGSVPRLERSRPYLAGRYEFKFGFEDLGAGIRVFDISVSYDHDGRRHSYDGSFEIVVRTRGEANAEAAKNIHIAISPELHASEAGRIRFELPSGAFDFLKDVGGNVGNDCYKAVEELVNLGARKYRPISLERSDGIALLQKPPPEAICKEIQLDFGPGFGKVQFFARPSVGIGHTYEGERYTDIIVDPPDGLDDDERVPYEKMSRGQCRLVSCGSEVQIFDGRCRSSGLPAPSTNGTYLNGEKFGDCDVRILQEGTIGLGTTSRETSLGVTLVAPSPESCKRCRLGGESREYCCRGGVASTNVVLRRRDGVLLVYVALWSCIDVGIIYKSFSGLEIFYDRDAFAWRRGTQRGWIVPGGRIELSRFSPILVSPVWDEANRSNRYAAQSRYITKTGDTKR